MKSNVYDGRSATQIRADAVRESASWAVGLTYKEARQYSIVKAIRSVCDERFSGSKGGFESEVSAQIERNLPANIPKHGGFYLPRTGMPIERAVTVLTAGDEHYGKETVFVQPQEFIDLLRNSMKVRALGARVLSGLVGNVAFPRQTSAATLTWTSEAPGSDIEDSALTLDQPTMSPKSAMSSTGYSRQLLAQSSLDVENLVRQDLAMISAVGIDRACIQGGGTHEPVGILAHEGIGNVEMGEAGAVPTLSKIRELAMKLETQNVMMNSPGFLTTPGVRGVLKQKTLIGTFPKFLWERNNGVDELINYRGEASNQVPSDLTKSDGSSTVTDLHALIFGNWSDLIIGEWGVTEILVDPYRLKKQGIIEVTSFCMVDCCLRHEESFAAALDCKLSDD